MQRKKSVLKVNLEYTENLGARSALCGCSSGCLNKLGYNCSELGGESGGGTGSFSRRSSGVMMEHSFCTAENWERNSSMTESQV